MADIELGCKSDHDLLVIAITKINAMDAKIDKVCYKVEQTESQLIVLQTEHNERKQQPDCFASYSQPISKKHLATSGGIGGLLGAAAVAVIEYFLRRTG